MVGGPPLLDQIALGSDTTFLVVTFFKRFLDIKGCTTAKLTSALAPYCCHQTAVGCFFERCCCDDLFLQTNAVGHQFCCQKRLQSFIRSTISNAKLLPPHYIYMVASFNLSRYRRLLKGMQLLMQMHLFRGATWHFYYDPPVPNLKVARINRFLDHKMAC